MKKITLFLLVLLLMSFYDVKANSQAIVYDINENFSTNVASWGFTQNIGTQTFTYESTNKLLQVRWSNGGSEHIKTLSSAIIPGTDNKLNVELIIKAYTCGNSSNYGAIYLVDENDNVITGFHVRRGSIGGSNKWFVGRSTSYVGTTTFSYPTSADGLNADQPIVKLSYVLDFTAKTLDFSAIQGAFDYSTRVFTASGSTVSSSGQAFINASATNLKKFKSWYYRGATASGTNGLDLMYAGISALRNVSLANVTVNYLDPAGNPIQSPRVVADNVVGSIYTALNSDKLSITTGGFYYVYDASNTSSDNVEVLVDGTASINLKFTKSAIINSTYSWTGLVNSDWNETDANFSTDGTNSIGYQFGNGVEFNTLTLNKSVSLNNTFDLAANNMSVSGNGYTFSGNGKITGTGKLIVNSTGAESTSFNLTNELSGGMELNGGVAIILKDAASTKYSVADGATLNLSTNANFSKVITSSGTLNIIPTSNVTYSSTVTGGSTLQYNLVSAGSVSTSTFSALPTLNNTFSGNLNVSTLLPAAYFGTTISYATNKIALNDNVILVYPINPASDGSTTITIGELTGTSMSKIMGNRIARAVTYKLGDLNTDFTFSGTIESFGVDAWAGLPITNIMKTGSGTMTLSGNSTAYTTGTTTVNAGTLIVNGILGASTTITTVAANGILKGTGVIGGAATINGTLEGRLTFASSLTLAGTTKIVVNGFNAGEYDAINTVGALTYGGVLEVTVNGGNPAIGTSIKIANFGSQTGDFTQPVSVPLNYSFNKTTGMLTYDGTTGIENGLANQVRIYPTITNGMLHVDGDVSRVQVVNSLGQILMNKSGNGANTQLNLNSLAAGTYMIKVNAIDGTATTKVVFYQK